MAKIYPTIEEINRLKVRPTEGEQALLNFLEATLDDSFEVYFNPYLNGDRPDVLIMRKNYGVLIIEVKDWNLQNFTLNQKKKWVYTKENAIVKSPIDQVLRYKKNIYNLHIKDLLQYKIKDYRFFKIVACAVYFHCSSQNEINRLLVEPYQADKKYINFLKYNIDFIGRDSLEEKSFHEILQKRHLVANKESWLFTDNLYENFKRILAPSVHLKTQGVPYRYTEKQKEIIYSTNLEQRIRGVFGSGKTTVLAARAVQAYKRALERNPKPKILILTYNITLKNFIHDKLNRVDEDFPFECFTIINYHQFINAELNNLNIEVFVPEDIPTNKIPEYLEKTYYGNINLFEAHKDEIKKYRYDAVLIDEIQDYHRPWMDIIKNYYRDPLGDYVLFGDVKQNIYGQQTEMKDVRTNVRGVNDLKYCFRSDFKIQDLALAYQKSIFQDKYEIDDFSENKSFFGQEIKKEGYVNYMYLQNHNMTESIKTLYNIIRGNILNQEAQISPNDITIMGYTTNLLINFDAYYRYMCSEKTNSMLETIETMYMTHLNYIGENENNPNYAWFSSICNLLAKKMFPKREHLFENDNVKLRINISKLCTIYDLHTFFKNTFNKQLEIQCRECGISVDAFMTFCKQYSEQLKLFKQDVYYGNYKSIRENKKLHFWMNSGTIKISTINSFKGWESEVVFLIVEPIYDITTDFNLSFEELLYTGLTRCKRDLVIINFGNQEYDSKIRPIIDSVINK